MAATVSSPTLGETFVGGITNKCGDYYSTVAAALAIAFGIGFMPIATGCLLQVCSAAALLMASWVDTKTQLIPNRLTYPMILYAVGSNLLATLFGTEGVVGVVGIEESLKGLGLCFALMMLLFYFGATGGGDVKLATAIGAFMGPQAGLMSIAWCHVLAGGFAIGWTLSQLNYLGIFRHSRHYLFACLLARRLMPIDRDLSSLGKQRIPMAAFFALGVLTTQLGFRIW